MAVEQHPDAERVAPEEVRAALERVLASETFRGSPQLATFLRFVVNAVLSGTSGRIKGYTIGVEAFGRPENFDPQIDPIVRVEATRLRRTLERYYAGPGASDPIMFELSRGSYVPVIRRQSAAEIASRPSPVIVLLRDLPRSRVAQAAAAAILVVAVLLGVAMLRDFGSSRLAEPAPGPTFDGPLQPGNGLPTLLIPRPTVLGPPPSAGAARPQLSTLGPGAEKVRAALARFDTVNVVVDADSDLRGGQPEPGTDYRLLGSAEFLEDGSFTARFRLLDSGATLVWSRNFGPFAATTDYAAIEDQIVRQLAMTLGPPFGVIRARERIKHLGSSGGDPRARCIVEASESFRSFDSAQHARARGCLELLTKRDPGFALGFAYLAAVYSREYQYALAGEPDEAILDRALQAAQRGVELIPESARAYQMLATVLFARRDIAGALAAGERAMKLNPYDMTILSDYGGRLIISGQIDRGLELLSQTADEGAVRPSWYRFYLFLGSYLKNEMAAASRHAAQIATDSYPLGLLARALAAASEGNRDLATRAFDQLVALRPAWRANPRGELARVFPVPAVTDRLARDLVSAGLAQSE